MNPLFEGAFTVDGDSHHVQLPQNYLRTQHGFEARVKREEQESMVLRRDSDILHVVEKHRHHSLRRGTCVSDIAKCDADHLSFNGDTKHPVFITATIGSEISNRSIVS